MSGIKGKVALVTGAGRGIGRAIAEELASDGADIALCDLQQEWMADAAAAIKEKGVKVECFVADVSKSNEVDLTVEKALQIFGKIDILVNNAGITRDTLLVRMSEEDWDSVLSVNLKGAFLFSKAVAKPMMKQRSGCIVNIASIIGLIGNAGQCNYAASKGGLISLTKSCARELASRNIRVNAVAPGFIQSKMTEVLPEDVKNRMLEAIPMKRFGTPADVAKVVKFLVSDSASYITGQVLTVSGGMVM